MKRKIIISSVLFIFMMSALVAVGFSKDKPVVSKWVAAPPSIDGMNTEWADVSLGTYKKAKIDYGFTEAVTPQGHIGVQVWINQGMYEGEADDGSDAEAGKAPKKPKKTYKR